MLAANIISVLLLVVFGIPAAYFLLFSAASLFYRPKSTGNRGCGMRLNILIPAYRSDAYIADTVRSALDQDYERENLRVLVISDSMAEETDERLRGMGAEVLRVSFENSTKAKSLNAAMQYLGRDGGDILAVLDADNIVDSSFAATVAEAFRSGHRAVQAHRTAKNRDTAIAVIDAVSEEINNSIFRSGHNVLGLSSALIGSGMAFGHGWFFDMIGSVHTAGEDKEIELRLLEDGISVHYIGTLKVYDEKTRTSENYYNQRRRWTGSQYNIMKDAFRGLGRAGDKVGYTDKLVQWLFPPRMIILATVPVLTVLAVCLSVYGAWAWVCVTAALAAAMIAGTPRDQMDSRLLISLLKIPHLAVLSFANLFRISGTKDKFIHTHHQ